MRVAGEKGVNGREAGEGRGGQRKEENPITGGMGKGVAT